MQEVRLLHEKLDSGSGTTDNIYELTETSSRIFKKTSFQAFGSTRSHFVRRKFDKPWFGPACKIARKNIIGQEIFIILIKTVRIKKHYISIQNSTKLL